MPEQRQERHGLRAWWHGMALAGVSGVALQLQQAQLYEAAVYMGALVLSGLLLAGVMRLACGAWHWLALPLVMAGCWGWSGWLAVQRLPTLPAELQGRDFDVQGVVTNMPQRGAQSLRFVLSLEQFAVVPKQGVPGLPAGFVMPERLSLSWYPGRSALDSAEEQGLIVPDVHVGQRWRMRVRLKTPHGQLNPSGFDYEL